MFQHLQRRHLQPEQMDAPDLAPDQHRKALAGLNRTHRFSGMVNRFWRQIRGSLQRHSESPDPTRISDIGCGDGFLLRQIAKRAKSAGFRVQLSGIDFSPTAIDLASQNAREETLDIAFEQMDVTKDSIPTTDILINSLFLHHFEDQQILRILENFKSATKRLMMIEDLERTRWGYCLCYVAIHTLSRSPIVHYDGMRSVEGALTRDELSAYLRRAQLADATVMRRWPERLVVHWEPC